jgi:hypothetical protein
MSSTLYSTVATWTLLFNGAFELQSLTPGGVYWLLRFIVVLLYSAVH